MSKTEKEKLLAGELYNSRDPELLALYHQARRLTAAFNSAASTETERKQALLTELLGRLGRHVWIEAPFYCDYGQHISIGDHTFINMNCVFLDNHYIRIGKNGLIAPGVHIYTALHPLRADDRIRSDWQEGDGTAIYRTQAAPVTIGDNAWIGGCAMIMPGVTIGDNATIGAHSVVTKDIPSNVLALGNPCRVVRTLEEGGKS